MAKEMLRRRFVSAAPEYEPEISYVFENYPTLLKEYPYAIPWVRDLKARGYKVYYLSNYGRWPYEQSKSQLGFMDYTDGGLLSYEVHMVKPERTFYLELLDRYDIDIDLHVIEEDGMVGDMRLSHEKESINMGNNRILSGLCSKRCISLYI